MSVIFPPADMSVSYRSRKRMLPGIATDEADDGSLWRRLMSPVQRYELDIVLPGLTLAQVQQLEKYLNDNRMDTFDIDFDGAVYRCALIGEVSTTYHGARLATLSLRLRGEKQ